MRRFVALATVALGLVFGGFAVLTPSVIFAKTGCVCKCIPSFDPKAQWTNLTEGNLDCRADCAEACGGSANLLDPETGGRRVEIACIPDSNDCSKGSFSIYEGVNCALQYDSADPNAAQTWPETSGQKPTCVVPLTPKNANIECAQFGGEAKGGTCGKLESGDNPNAYYKSRPNFGGQGTTINFSQNYTFTTWEAALDALRPGNRVDPTDGICYRYGVRFGGAPTYEGFDPGENGENIGFGTTPTNKNVCLKPKRNTCGTATPPTGKYGSLPARAYSCQREVDVRIPAGQSLDSVCFPVGGDTCVASAGTRCCQGGASTIGECLVNSECSLDGSKICSNGKCVINDVCDPLRNQVIPASGRNTPWLFDQRRCRNATDVEKANSNICSPPGPTLSACPNTAQSCCRAPNPAVISGCASDFVVAAGSSSVFNDFTCVDSKEIPASQYITVDGNRTLVGFDQPASSWNQYSRTTPARHCLTTTVPKYDASGRLTGSVARCGSGSLCCNGPRLVELGGAASFGAVNRAALGATCGAGAPMICRSLSVMLPPDNDAAKQRGFITPAAYLVELGKHKGCQLTPFDPNLPAGANKECVAGAVCCDPAIPVFASLPCQSDAECSAGGLVCDKTLGICINNNFVGPTTLGTSCLTAARTAIGAQAVTQLTNVNPNVAEGEYQCQRLVSDGADTVGKCLPSGVACGGPQGGQDVRCCIPGVGLPVSSAAALQPVATITPSAPFSLALPACIKSGNCTLEDIVTTGANFANFLLQIVGSIFLAIFVYGGFKYLTAGTSGRAEEARKMLVTAAKGVVLIMVSYVFVNFVQSSLVGGRNPGQSESCVALSTPEQAYACQFLVAPVSDSRAISEEISRRSCQRNKCPGPANYVCCPQ